MIIRLIDVTNISDMIRNTIFKTNNSKFVIQLTAILSILLFNVAISFSQNKAILTLTVHNIERNQGQLLIAVSKHADTFGPGKSNPYWGKAVKVDATTMQVEINIPYGEYALAILHDENGNRLMDYNLIRMPKEGYGFSNMAPDTFRPPGFEEAKFVFSEQHQSVQVFMIYL